MVNFGSTVAEHLGRGSAPSIPAIFEKNRVKLLILRAILYHFNASADSYVSAKFVFRQSKARV